MSPSAPACPPFVVTSWPGSRVIPYLALALGSSACWLMVLWSVIARKSRPLPAASSASSGTVSPPSECTVWVCRSPASHRRPGSAGNSRRGGRSRGAGGGGGPGGSRPAAHTAGPAPEAARAEASQVEYGPVGPLVLQLHPQSGRSRPDLHRQVVPG